MFTDTILILAAGVFGFFLGRFSVHRIVDETVEEVHQKEGESNLRRRDRKGTVRVEKFSLGSPVSGMVTSSNEGEKPALVIRPEMGKVYAPAGGRVKKIFPGGSELLFVTEFGAEMHISVGDVRDDLLERYYRPRVVQNEIVPRGRLLMEFDGAGITAEGGNADVFLRMENVEWDSDVELTAEGRVKVGETIVKIY